MAPQPIDYINPKADFILTTEALVDRPELSNIVTQVFALWTVAEQEFQVLFSRIIGPDENISEAVFSALQSEAMQTAALKAAAKVKFGESSEEYRVFNSVVDVYKRASLIRHKLAHWRWGISHEIPNALLLADPKNTKPVLKTMSHMRTIKPLDGESRPERTEKILQNITFDRTRILVFTTEDLKRGLSELGQSTRAFFHFDLYINPQKSAEEALRMKALLGSDFAPAVDMGTSAEALRQLSSLSLFQEAYKKYKKE